MMQRTIKAIIQIAASYIIAVIVGIMNAGAGIVFLAMRAMLV